MNAIVLNCHARSFVDCGIVLLTEASVANNCMKAASKTPLDWLVATVTGF